MNSLKYFSMDKGKFSWWKISLDAFLKYSRQTFKSTLESCIKLDVWLKLKIVPDSWEYIGFWKFGPYWPQK